MEDSNGTPVVELVTAGTTGRKSIFLKEGDMVDADGFNISFNPPDTNNGNIYLYMQEGILKVKSPVDLHTMSMLDSSKDTLKAGEQHMFEMRKLYSAGVLRLVLKDYYEKGNIAYVPSDDKDASDLMDIVQLQIVSGNEKIDVDIKGKKGRVATIENVQLANNISLNLTYGSKLITVPFKLQLVDFILERYPGSNSPSWYESQVKLIDEQHNVEETRRIFMNNILKHQGYRFYQSSYDTDEMGTVLSVNKDLPGTAVTYFGYLLLAVGMAWSLFNPNSRFMWLFKENNRLRSLRKALGIALLMSLGLAAHANQNDSINKLNVVSPAHAKAFGQLLVQDIGGRTKPVNSLSSEVLRKISRKDNLLGLTSDQVLLGMIANPHFWQTVPLIKISHPQVKELLGTEESLVSFSQLLDTRNETRYVLGPYIEEANQKKPAYRSKFDNDIIKVDERVNICYLIFTGQLMRIFPKQDDPTNKWYAPNDAFKVFSGEDSIFVKNIMPLYLSNVNEAIETGNWTEANEMLGALMAFQQKFGTSVLPPANQVKLEIFYNNLNLFERLSSIYGLIGFVLLVLIFIQVFKPSIKVGPAITVGKVLVIIAFLVHTAGLALRWHISGHAPWSNGYESLIYIAWATILQAFFSLALGYYPAAT
ncbi:MAG: cytochrome C biogenesis protein, partial [Bacteroidales bacterium]|nr:cytochrome C biogenesis protein [Bacteroidales bacterium]